MTLRLKIGYYLDLLMPETVKLLKRTKSKITKDENGDHIPCLEITEVVLVHCNIVNSDHQYNSRIIHSFLIIHLVNR